MLIGLMTVGFIVGAGEVVSQAGSESSWLSRLPCTPRYRISDMKFADDRHNRAHLLDNQ